VGFLYANILNFLVFFAITFNVNANYIKPLFIDEELQEHFEVSFYAYESNNDSLTIENIAQVKEQFVPFCKFNPQEYNSTFWFFLDIKNKTKENITLALDFGHITYVTLHEYVNSELVNPRYSGSFTSLDKIKATDGSSYYYLNEEASGQSQYYLEVKHVKGRIPYMEFKLLNYFRYMQNEKSVLNLLYLLLGVNIVIVIFSMYLFIVFGKKVYLWLSLFVFGFLFYELVVSGILSSLYPKNPELIWKTLFIFINIGVIGGILLLIDFFDLRRNALFFYKTFKIIIYFLIFQIISTQLLLLVPYQYNIATRLNISFASVVFMCIIIMLIVNWRKFDRLKKKFSIVLFAYFICVFIAGVLLFYHGDKAIVDIIQLNMLSGIVAYLFFLDSIGQYSRRYLKEREEMIIQLNSYKNFLEETVEERTDEMAKAYKQQIEQQKELSRQKEHIELLIREVHHRVKNNLQLFLSFYELQIDDPKASDLSKILEDGQKRIRVMALVHDMLYNGKTGEQIEVKEFIRSISNFMKLSVTHKIDVDFLIICPELSFDLDTAIPIGLVLNELLTNTLKHAEVESDKLRITIVLTQISVFRFSLEVIDNAKPIGHKNKIDDSRSFGIKMIKLICRQMGGNFSLKSGLSNHFIINFMSSEGLKQHK
jgi:two-component sensor histidine kinase